MIATQPAQTYRNVMEPLVVEEAERQIKQLPTKILQYLNRTEVIAYALNRLPSMYATSQKGWQQQQERACKELRSQIVAAVRQAIAAIQRDPLRSVAPLRIAANHEAHEALVELRDLLQTEDLAWQNVVDRVEQTLIRTARGEITWRKRGSNAVSSNPWRGSRYRL